MKKFEDAKLTLIRIDGDVITTSVTGAAGLSNGTDTGEPGEPGGNDG